MKCDKDNIHEDCDHDLFVVEVFQLTGNLKTEKIVKNNNFFSFL